MSALVLLRLGMVDEFMTEPGGRAYGVLISSSDRVAKFHTNHLYHLADLPVEQLLRERDLKYRKMGMVGGGLATPV
jgi:acetyl-CoA carboxylase carboxyl transferase subunit alpha